MPTMETSSPSRNTTPHRTAMRPQTDRSQRAGEEGEEAMRRHITCTCIDCKGIVCPRIYCRRMVSSRPPMATSDDQILEAWRGLLDAHAKAHCALERALKDHDLGVSEYEV